MNYKEIWEKINEQNDILHSLYISYWDKFSDYTTWQFWLIVISLIFPLIILFIAIDRRRLFEILFFGYTVHLLWAYIDLTLSRGNFLTHTYFLFPLVPNALNITGSFLPVGYILVYQYATNHQKNFYILTILLSALNAFVFANIEEAIGLVTFHRGVNAFHLFLLDLVIVFVSFWFTKLLLKFRINKSEEM
ncbi:hypothetical protein ACTQ5K_00020 [Niallia sp. Sow4_A1]|uniref:hypothetical protein n=1 Tax=Bacillaceae TaxID=186817 RepID=UPI0004E1A3B7|nr:MULTISPECIES: hypothetical protein [Bacillaceae]MCM3361059.1 hypothetical protein [Niallia sp. MER TA 168]